MRLRVLAALCSAVLLAVPGCGSGPRACTLIGGTNGIELDISTSLFVTSGTVHFTVCDLRGCASVTRPLGVLPSDAIKPTERGSDASFHRLGRTFVPGHAKVTVELRGPQGHLVAERTETIELVRTFPNGRACDGDGYVSGGLELRARDRV